jgi:SAM-dependent methyltransferase
VGILETTANFRDQDGILVDAEWAAIATTAQFLDNNNAETYHERYRHDPWWTHLIDRGLSLAGVRRDLPLTVLDIGTGSGNTIFPLLNLLPKAKITASDISAPLLRILKRTLASGDYRNVDLYCFDLHKDVFQEATFDLIIGGAILHHCLDPGAALKNLARWLRPGGPLILYEPLEYGAHILSALFQLCIDVLDETKENDARLIDLFIAMKRDFGARQDAPVRKEWTERLDDKWLFSKTYLRKVCTDLGFRWVEIHPLVDDLSQMYLNHVKAFMSLTGNGGVQVPAPVLDIISDFDAIPDAFKRALILEGIVIFRR